MVTIVIATPFDGFHLMSVQPASWRGRSEQISLDQVGRKARKTPAKGEVFFLDFPLYRTYQDMAEDVEM